MNLEAFLNNLRSKNKTVRFEDTIAIIDANYHFTETRFKNGDIVNLVGENNGSCKIFAFALLNNLNEQEALECFGDFYRVDVLQTPQGEDHQNIRNFIRHGWQGIHFEGTALKAK